VLDLTGGDEISERELRKWRSTPQQILSELKRTYPNGSESTIRRRLRRGLVIKPVKTFYSSHSQNCLHLSRINRSDPTWETKLKVIDQQAFSSSSTEMPSTDLEHGSEEAQFYPSPSHRGILLHPLSTADHPDSYKSLESKGSCISDWAWYPVLDAIGKFFTDVSLMSASGSGQFPSFLDLNGPVYSDELRKPPRQSPFCIDSGLHEDWIQPLKRLWQVYPSQMLLFIEKQMVMALREVRSKILSADTPPPPWTFWRRPNTPMCGLAPSNCFNPEYSHQLEGNVEMDTDVLSPTLVNELTHRDSQFVVPSRGIPLEPMDALAITVLHRVMAYWEVMKVKVKELAQIIDSLISNTSKQDYFNILMWYLPLNHHQSASSSSSANQASAATGDRLPSASYYSYNPFSLPGQDFDLRFDWIFQLIFRTVILRNYSVRSYLRRACFIYRQLFSLDQPKEVSDMLSLHSFEEDVQFMDENAWQWKFRLSVHHYITSSRVSHELKHYPILYSPLVLPLLASVKDRSRQKQEETLSTRWPILTANHLHAIASRYPPHRLGSSGEKVYVAFSAMHLLEFPLAMPMGWNLLKDLAMSHSRIVEIVQRARRKHATSYILEDLDGSELKDNENEIGSDMDKEKDKNMDKDQNEQQHPGTIWNAPNAVAGYVTPAILSNILMARSNELDDDWSDDSDADYPEDDLDDEHGFADEYGLGGSASIMSDDHSEYEYYDSDEEQTEEGDHRGGGLKRLEGAEEDQHDHDDAAMTMLQEELALHQHGNTDAQLRVKSQSRWSVNGDGSLSVGGVGGGTKKRFPNHYDEDNELGNNKAYSISDGTQIDWSKIDTELVAAVMEGSSREDIARVIARRLGLGASQLPYEIADLIPEALMLRKKKSSRTQQQYQLHQLQSGNFQPSTPHRLPHDRASLHHQHQHHHHIDLPSLAVPFAVPPPPPPFEEDENPSSASLSPSVPILTMTSDCSTSQEVLSAGKAATHSTVRPTHTLIGPNGQTLTLAEPKLDKLYPRLRPSRVTPTAKDVIFQAPFGADSANGLSLPIPSAPAPPSLLIRIRNRSSFRTLTQPFDSDDDGDDDDGDDRDDTDDFEDSYDDVDDDDDDDDDKDDVVGGIQGDHRRAAAERRRGTVGPPFRTKVVYNPDAPAQGNMCLSSVYPFSVASRLHNIKMNDPFEGTTMYKLKSNPASSHSSSSKSSAHHQHHHLQQPPSKSRSSASSIANNTSSNSTLTASAAAAAKLLLSERAKANAAAAAAAGAAHHHQHHNHQTTQNQHLHSASSSARSESLHSHQQQHQHHHQLLSNAPGIADTSKSVDELLEFIEGPSANSTSGKTKGGKKKTGSTPISSSTTTMVSQEEKKNSSPSTAIPSIPTSVDNARSSSPPLSLSSTTATASSQKTSQHDTTSNRTKQETSGFGAKEPLNQVASSKNDSSKGDAHTTTTSTTQGKKESGETTSKAHGSSTSAPTSTSATPMSTKALTSELTAKTVPINQYPEFWNEEDESLNPEQRKALDDEISAFQSLLETSLSSSISQPPIMQPSVSSTDTKKKSSHHQPQQHSLTDANSNSSIHGSNISYVSPKKHRPVTKFGAQMFASIASKSRDDGRNMFKRGHAPTSTTTATTTSSSGTSPPSTAHIQGQSSNTQRSNVNQHETGPQTRRNTQAEQSSTQLPHLATSNGNPSIASPQQTNQYGKSSSQTRAKQTGKKRQR